MRRYLLISFLLFCSLASFAQEIKYNEEKERAKNIEYVGPPEKAMLIIQTDMDLSFEASNDSLSTISKNKGIYKIPIDAGSQILTIKSVCCGRIMLNFIYNDLGALKPKEVRYFSIKIPNVFGEVVEVTKEEKAKGMSDFPGYNDKDGFLFFYLSALPNIELQFQEKNGYVTKVTKETDRYQLYAKSGVPIDLTISAKGYDDLTYSIDTLGVKEVKYFRLFSLNSFVKTTTSDNSLKKGTYKIITDPIGAIIEIDGNPYFNKQPESERKTPKVIEENAGLRKITVSLDKYEKITDTISIGGEKNISEYKLIPTISNLRFNIIPTNADVFIDDEKIPFTNGTNVEVKKGVRFIEINAPHYYTQSFNIQTYPNQIHKINKTLLPIMGALSITSSDNAVGADIFIDGTKSIGKVPLINYPIQEGSYLVRLKKNGFATKDEDYKVTITENKTTSKSIEMVSSLDVYVKSSPDGADVTIDGQQMGRTNMKIKLGIGTHTLIINKENYEIQNAIIEVTDNVNGNNFTYSLIAKMIPVVFNTRPAGVLVTGDGIYLNISEHTGNTELSLGIHKVQYSKKGYFTKKKIINVSNVGKTFNAKLFRRSFGQLGISYGLNVLSLNIAGCMGGHFYLGAGFGINMTKHNFSQHISVKNANVDDILSYNAVGTIKSDSSSLASCINVKVGCFFQKPIYFILSVGYSTLTSKKYQNVYQASHNYVAGDGTKINTGDYFTSSPIHQKRYNAFTAGLAFPIARRFYIGADYYSNSEVGMGVVFNGGIIF